MTSTLSMQLKPELDGVAVQLRYYEREAGTEGIPRSLWAQYARVMQRVSDAVGLDVIRDAEVIYTGDYELHRAQINPISLQVVYTEDGLPIEDPLTWHQGPSGDSIRYERFNISTGARLAHGYVDRESRRLTQSG